MADRKAFLSKEASANKEELGLAKVNYKARTKFAQGTQRALDALNKKARVTQRRSLTEGVRDQEKVEKEELRRSQQASKQQFAERDRQLEEFASAVERTNKLQDRFQSKARKGSFLSDSTEGRQQDREEADNIRRATGAYREQAQAARRLRSEQDGI